MAESTQTRAPRGTARLASPEMNPSFTRGVFLGEIQEHLISPFPEETREDQEALEMILASFRDFAAAAIDPARHDREGRFTEEARTGLHELGLMGLGIPEDYGGFGASSYVFNRVFGEIGAADGALAVYFGAHQSIGCKGIVLFGTEEQKHRLLPRCATGETVAAFCLTEPGSGSDAQAMKARAVPSDDGSHFTLNGTKIWISNAGYASLLTVFAKVPVTVDGETRERVTAFVVDAHADGVRLGKVEEKMGIKASDTRTIYFENVRVPAENRLGEVGQGFRIALEILNSGRLGLAAASAHGTRRIMREALAHAAQREQFGRPIGKFEMIQRKLALLAAECYAADAGWMLTAGMVDHGGVDYSLETAICKVHNSEMAFRACSEAMQIAGGIGYSKEYPYERALRDARINLIFEGTNEILRALIALSGLQQPGERLREIGASFRDPLNAIGAIGHFLAGRARRTISRASFRTVPEALEREAEMVATNIHQLGNAVERALMRHGRKIIDRQMMQERMANAAIDIYLSTAALMRGTRAISRAGGDVGRATAELDLIRLFVPMAMRRTRRSIRGISRNDDPRTRAIAERALEQGELAPEP